MADIVLEGMDDLIRALDAAGKMDEDTIQEILEAGADVAVEEIRREIRRSRYRIADYAGHVQRGKVKRKKGSGDPYISVTLSGNTKNGTPRSTVAFVLNYGREERTRSRGGAIAADYFWTRGTQNAQKKAAEAMEAVLRDKLKQEGL